MHDFEIERYKGEYNEALKAHKGKRKKFVHAEADIAETFASARRAIKDNKDHVLSYFHEHNIGPNGRRFTNAATEAINGIIKQTQRIGRGYLFENLEARVLLREPYAPLLRKPHVNKREKTRKLVNNTYLTETGPVPRNQTTRKGKVRTTKCASNGCKTRVILPVDLTLIEPGIYEVPHIFRFCNPCFEARLPYTKDGVDETDRYVRQIPLRLNRPRWPGEVSAVT